MSPTDWIAAALIALGIAGLVVSALGLLRLPDFYTRLHVIRLASMVAVPLFLAGLGLHALDLRLALKLAIVGGIVLLLGAPAAHVLASAAHGAGLAPYSRPDKAKRP